MTRRGAGKEAKWHPVLLLRPRNYDGKPIRLHIGLKVCDDCRSPIPDPFITEKSWLEILMMFDEAKRARPHRILTDVDYVPISTAFEIDRC